MGIEDDFKKLCKEIPIEAHQKQKLRKWFNSFDPNGNGLLSLAEVDKGIRDVMKLDGLFESKAVIIRAFNAAKDSNKKKNELKPKRVLSPEKQKQKNQEKLVLESDPLARIKKLKKESKRQGKGKKVNQNDYVSQDEFRTLLLYLRQQMELWIVQNKIDSNQDKRVSPKEFREAIDMIACWGIDLNDPDAAFREIDDNGGGFILFDEFANWVITQGLDDDDDDDEAV